MEVVQSPGNDGPVPPPAPDPRCPPRWSRIRWRATRRSGASAALVVDDFPGPREIVAGAGTPSTIAGWKALADGLLTTHTCAFHRNVEISARYAWMYGLLPACLKWAGMAALASHHVRLALYPLRLATDCRGVLDIPQGPGQPQGLPARGRQHHPGDEQRHLRRHLLGPPRLHRRRRRHRVPPGTVGLRARLRRRAGGFRADRPRPPGPGGPRVGPGRARGGATSSSGRATSGSSSTSSGRWCSRTSTGSRAGSPGSPPWARRRVSRSAACATSCATSPRSTCPRPHAGVRTAARARGWPRITEFDDRWRWLESSVVPRFRRLDAHASLFDLSLRRIREESHYYVVNPCVLRD